VDERERGLDVLLVRSVLRDRREPRNVALHF
jgi:hypothetical protein